MRDPTKMRTTLIFITPHLPPPPPADTSNFDVDESDFTPKEAVPLQSNSIFSGNHLPFVGFTYTKGSKLSDLECLLEAGKLGVNVPGRAEGYSLNHYISK